MIESFPDADNVFRYAFNLPNPTPTLLELIHAHPEVPTIRDLVVIYMDVVEMSPTQIDEFTGALVNVKNSSEITIASYDRLGNPGQIPIALALNLELDELLRGQLAGVDEVAVRSSNEFLIASLLAAAVTKYGLCDSTTISYTVKSGLDYANEYSQCDIATHEVLVLGTCLQLSISGSYLCGPQGLNPGDVLSALERIKASGVLKDADGQRLLEATIQQANDGFKSDIDGWRILFPPQRS